MRIWWFWRFSMESFLFFGVTYYFVFSGGYFFNYRNRYIYHKQKRERSNFCNPYFVPPNERKLNYDVHFNVTKKENLVEANFKPQFYNL